MASILAVLSTGPSQAQIAQQSATPAQPTGIADSTDSGDDNDLITNHTSITVTGGAVSGATVALAASATRNGADYTTAMSADNTGGTYAITLDLAAATTEEAATLPTGSIDGAWNITAKQTESGKEESEPSPALTITIDTQDPGFNLWVGYPDGRTSGTGTRVNSISGGVRGLASHNGILYAIDDDTDSLRKIDITTGDAEIVGSFGSAEESPAGLASHNGVLYMVGGDKDALYSIDTATGQATQVGSFGATEPTPTGLASHDGVLYMVGDDVLYQIDTANGTATRVGSLGTEQTPTGLGSHNGILYMVGSGNNALYRIDVEDGTATRINGSAESFDVGESSPSGLASHSGVLYMAGAANSALYSLSTGVVVPQPVSGVAYLPKTTVVVRISGVDEPGGVTATRTIFGNTATWSGKAAVAAFRDYDHESGDGTGTVTVEISDAAVNSASMSQDIAIDTTAPMLTIDVPEAATGPFTATFRFNEAVTWLDPVDIAVEEALMGPLEGSGNTYTALITPFDPAVVTVTVPARAVVDLAGNIGPTRQVRGSTRYEPPKPVTITFVSVTYRVDESGDTLNVTLNLDKTPRREVVVPISVQPAGTASASSDYTLPDPSSVTFDADAAGAALTQTYTLAIIDDDYDEADETIILGFGTLPANVSAGTQKTTTVTITDDDTRGISTSIPSEDTRNIAEGGTYDYSVALTSRPTETVMVTLSASPENRLTLSAAGATPTESIDITFTEDDWNTPQTVTATATADPDGDDEPITITHTAAGGDYQDLTRDEAFTIVDNNVAPVFSPTSYTFNLAENLDGSSSPISLGTPVNATDSDTDDSVSYSITNGNTDDKFAIHPTSGQITYVGSGEDFESSTTSYTLTVTATSGTGGRAQPATAVVTVNITDVDDTPPSLTSTSFETDGNTGYAKEGDTITVTFQTSEELSTTPSAIIAGRTATVTGSDNNWTATYTVEAGINDDNASFDLGVISDDDGNEADPPAADTGIAIDTTAPSVTEVTPVTTPTTHSSPSYVFLSSEAGGVTYSGSCGNGSVTDIEAGTGTTTIFSSLLVGSYADCRITVTDAAGNSGMLSVSPFTVQLEQSAAPVQPSGITDATDSGADDDLITSSTSIDVMGVAANGSAISLTASATREGADYTVSRSASADAEDGAYVVILDLATATTDDSTDIPADSIDGEWRITARQTEIGKRESKPSPALTVTVDTQDPNFTLWVGYPDGQAPGTATKAGSISSTVTGLASHDGVLYAVDDGADALYSVDLATDTASRVDDDVTNFGLEETLQKSPGGLASHHGVLYMVAADDDALYSLDTSTGEATLIGSFGQTETSPMGLASHEGVLYMVGDSGDALYSIDTGTGAASPVGSFGTLEQAPSGLASHNGVLYMTGDHGNALYSLDPVTGEATLLGSFDSSEQTPTGLTSYDRVLYLTGAANSALYALSTGVAIPEPIDGVVHLRKSTVFVRISGVDDPGTATATRTVFGDTDQQSGETSVLTFSNYDHQSDGTNTVVVEVTDAAGNVATLSRNVVIDTSVPKLTISGVPTVINWPFTATFEFNEVVTGFEVSVIMVENGTLSAFDAGGAPVYSALITPTSQGDVTVTVAAEAVTDRAGNPGPRLQVSKTTLYDSLAPALASVKFVTTGNPGFAKEGDTITVTFETNEDLSTTPSATIAGHTATLTGNGMHWEATYIVEAGVNADNAAFDLGAIADSAGNQTDPSEIETGVEVDTTAPTVSYTAPASMRVDVALSAAAPIDDAPTDRDFDAHTYQVKSGTQLPPGLSLDEVSGRITGTPTVANASEQATTVVATDGAGNIQEVTINFPAVVRGTQTLTGFAYSPAAVTFGGAAPVLIKPTGAQGDLLYTSDTPSVCEVEASNGELTISGAGTCTITATAAATANYEEGTAKTSVTVNPAGALSLTLNTVAGDNIINAAEKAAGVVITGNTGVEPTVSVTIAVGSTQLPAVISDTGGAWLAPIPAGSSYLVEPSIDIVATATKTGFTAAMPVTRTVTVDVTSPTVSYAAPSVLTVGVAIDNIDPTDAEPADDDYASLDYTVGPGSQLPAGLSLDSANGRITGTPSTAGTATITTAIAVTDAAGNVQEALIVFPEIAKGSQSLSDFSYNPEGISFGDPAPQLTGPTGAPGVTISYETETPLVCNVNESTGSLTILSDGTCTITITASETDDYEKATAQASVSVSPAGTLALSIDPVASDDMVNAAEKEAGFSITGRTGFEPATTVTVTMDTVEMIAISDASGLWSTAVPPDASYLVDPSVSIEATARKAGFTEAASVVRTVVVDTIAPMVRVSNPDQSSPAQSREFSAGDEDDGTTTWIHLVQSDANCPTVPPEEAGAYVEDDPVTLATEEFNSMHVCFWSTDTAGNVGSSVSAQITGIDTTAPTVGYAPPASMRVDENIPVIAPADGVPADDDFTSHTYRIKSGGSLPAGLSIDSNSGRITGAPTAAGAAGTTTVVVTDAAGNIQEVVIVFPEVAKGYPPLDDFAYDPSSIVFGDPAPALVAPSAEQGNLSYASDTPLVCIVETSTGELTIAENGICTITLTAAATDDYEEATAQATVTVHPSKALGLSVNAISDDDTINAAEKATGFAITGSTGAESGASVTVAIGSFQLAAISGIGGAWSVTVPSSAPYIAEPTARVLVTASKPGLPPARSVTRTLTVDTTAPTVSYASPKSMKVGERIPDTAPTDDTPTDSDFATHSYRITAGGTLPAGLSLDSANGRIHGTPTAASARPKTTTVVVTDRAGNLQEVSVIFPAVSKGLQSLTGFGYEPRRIVFGDPAPALTAPTGVPGATISYVSNSPSVCAVDASTGALTITGEGTCAITATASSTDDYEEAKTQTSVTVSPAVAIPPTNLAPVATANLPPVAISTLGDHRLTTVGPAVTVDVSTAFRDPDGDLLTYTARSSDRGVADVSASGSAVTIRPLAAGWASVRVTARDPNGLTASQIILITVDMTNQAPVTVGTIAARTLTTGGRSATLDMSSSFLDRDGDSLTYVAASNDRTVARVRLSGSVLTILPFAPGTAVVTVVVRDAGGLTASQSVPVTVAPVTAVSSDTEIAEAQAHVDGGGAVTVTIKANSYGKSTITVMAPADDGASMVTTATEFEVGEGIPVGTIVSLPDSVARSGEPVTASILLSEQGIAPTASFSAIVTPLVVEVALSATPSELVTICLPTDPEAEPGKAVLLQYEASTDTWKEVAASLGAEPTTNGAQALCADTKGSSILAVAYGKSRDATLRGLSLDALTLRPIFEAGVTEYRVSVAYEVENVTVTAVTADPGASVMLSPDDSSASTTRHQVPLNVGENVIRVTVTAEDASVSGTYTITVSRAPNLQVVSGPSRKPDSPRAGGV